MKQDISFWHSLAFLSNLNQILKFRFHCSRSFAVRMTLFSTCLVDGNSSRTLLFTFFNPVFNFFMLPTPISPSFGLLLWTLPPVFASGHTVLPCVPFSLLVKVVCRRCFSCALSLALGIRSIGNFCLTKLSNHFGFSVFHRDQFASTQLLTSSSMSFQWCLDWRKE